MALGIVFTSVVITVTLSSCIPVGSVHSIATPADTLWPSAWDGDWFCALDGDDAFARLSFYRGINGRSVRLTWSDGEDDEGEHYELVPVRLGERWFANAKLTSLTNGTGWFDSTEVEDAAVRFRLNFIARLDAVEDSLTLSYLPDKRLWSFLGSHHGWLKTRRSSGNDHGLDVTSDTPRLRRFLETFANVDTLFEPIFVFRQGPKL